jgi:glycosyltransferase involved in cell wall biosynthesis
MNIGLNYLHIDPNYRGGVNSYAFGLLNGFKAIKTHHRFRIFVSSENSHLFEDFKSDPRFEVLDVPGYFAVWRRGVRKLSLALRSELAFKLLNDLAFRQAARFMDAHSDVIYCPTTVLFPYNYVKPTVVSMHDIQQFHYPEFFSKDELLDRRVKFSLTAKHATTIQASSEFIRRDLLKHFPSLAQESIVVVPEGVDQVLFGAPVEEAAALLRELGVPEDFLFFPAQLWHHKNHITVLKALKRLKEEKGLEVPLILTGAKYSASETLFDYIRENGLEQVKYLGKVPFRTLIALYQKARLLITAVLYESSSLCILESAAAGRPILASRTPPNVEMSKILQLNLFDPLDVEALCAKLEEVWSDGALLQKQSEENQSRISHYSWENAARKYIRHFEGLAGKA